MKNMIKRQEGVTFIGWCIILAIIGFFVLITLRLFPLYNEKMQVVSAMKSVASRPGISEQTEREILEQFKRTVQIGGSTRFDDKTTRQLANVEKPKEKGGPRLLTVQFESRNKFFDDIEFVLVFDESFELKGGGTGE